jgi:hypothetical protein
VLTDSLGTLFLLPLITTMLVSAVVRREYKTGRPSARFAVRRGVGLGAVVLAVFTPAVIALLAATPLHDLSPAGFVTYKVVFGLVLGAIVTPLIALDALRARVP